jgi:uncharacterized protein (TIGR02246 family)
MRTGSTDRGNFIAYPTNRVVGTVADDDKAQAAIAALLRAGFGMEDIDILHDEKDLKRLDATGTGVGFLAQFHRTLIRAFDLEEFKHLTHHADDIRAGRFVIMVLTKRRVLRIVASDILHQHGAEFVGFYGRWACEELPATARRAPQDIPALFARAWNDRDADVLASLFDEDAEFVNVTGVCWHDRASIREAHANGLERIFSQSHLAIDETKVKLLSPDIAVVHARMTLSELAPEGAVNQPGSHTTMVSFVVHRIADRWQCASAHSTDVIPKAETQAPDAAGRLGWADQPGP